MEKLARAGASAGLDRNRARRIATTTSTEPLAPLYTVKLAADVQEFRAALRLRYEVFNRELGEGLQSAHSSGHDCDSFDAVVDHIIVKCVYSNRVVGTYRLQTGAMAARNLGYYGEREFDFAPYETLRASVLELGRACIHRDHRNTQLLMLLWKAIAQYGIQRGCRYLIGCSSLTSQEPAMGMAVYYKLKKFLAPPELQTTPQAKFACATACAAAAEGEKAKLPKLLRAYLTIGAQICGPPALDGEFGTIDFLTLLDLARVPKGLFSRATQRLP